MEQREAHEARVIKFLPGQHRDEKGKVVVDGHRVWYMRDHLTELIDLANPRPDRAVKVEFLRLLLAAPRRRGGVGHDERDRPPGRDVGTGREEAAAERETREGDRGVGRRPGVTPVARRAGLRRTTDAEKEEEEGTSVSLPTQSPTSRHDVKLPVRSQETTINSPQRGLPLYHPQRMRGAMRAIPGWASNRSLALRA